MQDTECLGLVHWDYAERWYGEGGGRGIQDWEHVYTHGGFMLCMAKPIQYCKVKKKEKEKEITAKEKKKKNLRMGLDVFKVCSFTPGNAFVTFG